MQRRLALMTAAAAALLAACASGPAADGWVTIIHRGKFKSLNPQQKAWLRRRQAVEPAIGHLKSDHRMDRCWLKGTICDALHTISCAAGYNLRWLLRAIAKLGIGPAFLCLLQMVLVPAMQLQAVTGGPRRPQLAA